MLVLLRHLEPGDVMPGVTKGLKRAAKSRKWTKELTSLAHRLGDEGFLLEALHCQWGDEYFAGNVAQLLETTEEGIRRYDPKRHAQLAEAFAGHVQACARSSFMRQGFRCAASLIRRAVRWRGLYCLPNPWRIHRVLCLPTQ